MNEMIVCGFSLLIQAVLSAWVIITLTRINRSYEISLGVMEVIAARSGFKEAVDLIQRRVPTRRKDN